MKKAVVLLISLPFLLLSCTHMGKQPASISWPERIDYLEALCEIDVMLKAQEYTGDMSLKVIYPHTLFLEVYSPFGTTILAVERSEDHFLMRTDDEEITDEREFFRVFRLRIDDIIEDLTLKGQLESEGGGLVKYRPDYTVHYTLNDRDNRICWKVREGDFCIKFFDVSFSRDKLDGKNNSGRN